MSDSATSAQSPNAEGGRHLLARLFGESSLEAAHEKGRLELEEASEAVRLTVLKVDAKALLGFLWGKLLLLQAGADASDGDVTNEAPSTEQAVQPLLCAMEYLHAVLSCHEAGTGDSNEEADLQAVLTAAEHLQHVLSRYTLVAAAAFSSGGTLDTETRTTAMQAMTTWAHIRGHRYQALEGEFFSHVLAPHDDALRRVYGVGAVEIASGLQRAVDAMRFGHMRAFEQLRDQQRTVQELASNRGVSMEDAVAAYQAENPAAAASARSAISDVFFGGLCDVGKSSGLPSLLLDDLSFCLGDEKEFFSEGPLRGTPMRRLPARQRPLVLLNGSHFACDPNFLRDSAYRALQWGLCKRDPSYEEEWGRRQATVTEEAFPKLFASQLTGSSVFSSVYYQDVKTKKWAEADLVILFNDVLIQVEAKAGVMPMHSPELNFKSHVRTIQNLVVKAKEQCERFINYLASADEVPLYRLEDGVYQEVCRVKLSTFRQVVPVGLTVEAFTPFSSMTKTMPEMAPILGRFPFISMSVDDLMVLKRLLRTGGELVHYLSVRQRLAAQHRVVLFDELDHLGAYIEQNRPDMTYAEKLDSGATMLSAVGYSTAIDEYFADPEWAETEPPRQKYPVQVAELLASIDAARGPRFLRADNVIRDLSAGARTKLDHLLARVRGSLKTTNYRWFSLVGEASLLVWVQRSNYADVKNEMRAHAEALALSSDRQACEILVVYVSEAGKFEGAWATGVAAPRVDAPQFVERLEAGRRLEQRMFRS